MLETCPHCGEKGYIENRCIKCGIKTCRTCGKDIRDSKFEHCAGCIVEYWGPKVEEKFPGMCLSCGGKIEYIGHCTARTCKQCCADGKCLYEEKCINDKNTFGVKGIKPKRIDVDDI